MRIEKFTLIRNWRLLLSLGVASFSGVMGYAQSCTVNLFGTPVDKVVCRDNDAQLGVNNSVVGQKYNFNGNGKTLGGPLDGNGGALSVTAGVNSAGDAGTYSISTATGTSSCSNGFVVYYGNIDDLSITAWGGNSVSFKWASSGESGKVLYEYQVSTDPNFVTLFNTNTTTNTSVTVNGLTGGATYYIRVRLNKAFNHATPTPAEAYYDCSNRPWSTIYFTSCAGTLTNIGSITGNSYICVFGTTDLVASGGVTYQWYKDGTILSGSTSATYTVSQKGEYSVYITTASGCKGLAYSKYVALNSVRNVTVTPSSGNLCNVSQVTLTANDLYNVTYGSTGYKWYLNGVAISGATAQTYSATTPGNYSANAFNGACYSTFPAAVKIDGNVTPGLGGTGTYCTAEAVNVGIPETQVGQAYSWYQVGVGKVKGPLDGNGNAQSLQFNISSAAQAGTYYVVSTKPGCADVSSSMVDVYYAGIYNINTTSIASTSVAFAWSPAGKTSGQFEYKVNTTPTLTPQDVGTSTSANTATVGSLLPSTTYYIHVRGLCGYNFGTTGNWVDFQFITAVPSPTSYYPKTTATDLSQTSNWTSNVSGGSGSSPANFTSTLQLFNINDNVSNPTVANPWTLSGGSNMILNSTNALVFTSAASLTVGSGSTVDLNSKQVIFRSAATGTASLGTITGTLSNATNVTAERYISNRRAWRLLGIPFTASAQTIKTSWMENGASPAGYGTQITTFTGDVNAAGFDAVKSASSIRRYASDNFNSDATHTPGTASAITGNQAFFLFVRGDRTVDRTAAASPSSVTTLRITGTPFTGATTKGVTGTSFSLVPNPYLSSVDFDAIKNIAANSGIAKFYVWDASLGTVGQYRTIDVSGSSPTFTYTATPGGVSASWRFIESGTAFFVPGNRTVDFTEATKSAGTPPSSMLRTISNQTELVVNLYSRNADNTLSLYDGVREVFDNAYSNAIDKEDAKKIMGFDLNLGISNGAEILSIEKRNMPAANDVINLNLANAAQGNYQFEIQPANFQAAAFYAYVKDNYFNTYTPLSLSTYTKVDFTVTGDAASSAANRFSIVFTKAAMSPSLPAIVVYPNPVQSGNITLLMNNMPGGVYTVRLVNGVGQTLLSQQVNHAQGTATESIHVKNIRGSYMLEITKPDNSKSASKIIIN